MVQVLALVVHEVELWLALQIWQPFCGFAAPFG